MSLGRAKTQAIVSYIALKAMNQGQATVYANPAGAAFVVPIAPGGVNARMLTANGAATEFSDDLSTLKAKLHDHGISRHLASFNAIGPDLFGYRVMVDPRVTPFTVREETGRVVATLPGDQQFELADTWAQVQAKMSRVEFAHFPPGQATAVQPRAEAELSG